MRRCAAPRPFPSGQVPPPFRNLQIQRGIYVPYLFYVRNMFFFDFEDSRDKPTGINIVAANAGLTHFGMNNLKKLAFGSLAVSIAAAIGLAVVIRIAPYCEGDSECTFALAPYTSSALLVTILAATCAMLSLGLGLAIVGERFRWRPPEH